jgi:hypothetical protein
VADEAFIRVIVEGTPDAETQPPAEDLPPDAGAPPAPPAPADKAAAGLWDFINRLRAATAAINKTVEALAESLNRPEPPKGPAASQEARKPPQPPVTPPQPPKPPAGGETVERKSNLPVDYDKPPSAREKSTQQEKQFHEDRAEEARQRRRRENEEDFKRKADYLDRQRMDREDRQEARRQQKQQEQDRRRQERQTEADLRRERRQQEADRRRADREAQMDLRKSRRQEEKLAVEGYRQSPEGERAEAQREVQEEERRKRIKKQAEEMKPPKTAAEALAEVFDHARRRFGGVLGSLLNLFYEVASLGKGPGQAQAQAQAPRAAGKEPPVLEVEPARPAAPAKPPETTVLEALPATPLADRPAIPPAPPEHTVFHPPPVPQKTALHPPPASPPAPLPTPPAEPAPEGKSWEEWEKVLFPPIKYEPESLPPFEFPEVESPPQPLLPSLAQRPTVPPVPAGPSLPDRPAVPPAPDRKALPPAPSAEGTVSPSKGVHFQKGGKVLPPDRPQKVAPPEPHGPDVAPALLEPGEEVINRRAAERHRPLLKAINKDKGSKPQRFAVGGTVQRFAAGGAVGVAATAAGLAIPGLNVVTAAFEVMGAFRDSMTGAVRAVGSFASAMASPEARPSQFIASAGEGIDQFSRGLFYVSPALSIMGSVAGEATKALGKFTAALDGMVERYGKLNPQIALAQAMGDVVHTLNDLRRGNELAPALTQYVAARTELQQKIEDAKVRFINRIMPVILKGMEVLERLLPAVEVSGEVVAQISGFISMIADLLTSWFALFKDSQAGGVSPFDDLDPFKHMMADPMGRSEFERRRRGGGRPVGPIVPGLGEP